MTPEQEAKVREEFESAFEMKSVWLSQHNTYNHPVDRAKWVGYLARAKQDAERIEDLRRAVETGKSAIELLRAQIAAMQAGAPVAWVMPGDDNEKDNGWLDARVNEWGEFTRPLFAAPPPAAPVVPDARPESEWHEDFGDVTWWALADNGNWHGEPAYIGSPLDDNWPGYHTHWTPHPPIPAAPTGETK